MSLRTDRVRIIVSFKRSPKVSKEEFDTFWLNEYPTLFKSLAIAKDKVLKYEQCHANQTVNASIASVNLPISPYDALVSIEAATFDDLTAVFTSEEYRTVVGVPSMKYFERGGQFFAANFATVVDN